MHSNAGQKTCYQGESIIQGSKSHTRDTKRVLSEKQDSIFVVIASNVHIVNTW